jgi:hypothetical protein
MHRTRLRSGLDSCGSVAGCFFGHKHVQIRETRSFVDVRVVQTPTGLSFLLMTTAATVHVQTMADAQSATAGALAKRKLMEDGLGPMRKIRKEVSL